MRPIYQRGQVYPLFAFFLIPLLAVSALSVDIGYYRYQERAQQTAADSAAITGALQSQSSGSSSTITTAAQDDASKNGFTDGKSTVSVVVDSLHSDSFTKNGTGGAQSSASGTGVKVTITRSYGRFFGGFFFPGKQSISTSAVAILKTVTAANPCLTGLGDAPSITTTNGAKIQAPNCGVAINGDTTCNGGTINVASFAINQAATNNCSGGGTKFPNASPAPSAPITDPCQFYTGCAYIQNNLDGKISCGSTKTGTVTGTLKSSFNNGSFTCLSGATINGVTFNPGIYVIEKGALFQGTNTGTGVVFYVNDDTACACSSNSDVLDMENKNATLNFTAPSTSTTASDGSSGANYQGMVFYQNPSGLSGITPGCKKGGGTALNCVQVAATIGGTCPPGTTGVWYMRYASFLFDGHNNDCFTGNLIVDDATLNGLGSQISLFPANGGGSQPGLIQAYLVE